MKYRTTEHTHELDTWFASTLLFGIAYTISERSTAMNVPKNCEAATMRILGKMNIIMEERASLQGEKLLYYDDRIIEIMSLYTIDANRHVEGDDLPWISKRRVDS